MTFEEWVNNPAGKSAVMTNRQMYRDLYTAKFNKVMLREGNNFKFHCYKGKNNTFVIHIKVPSEVVPNFYYDVVIYFSSKFPTSITNTNLNKYDVQFYTNSPDFVYTHCYAYNKAKLFFTDLAPKMTKLSLTQKAVERNPHSEVGYVKSIYFAYLIMKYKGLFNKVAFETGETFSIKKLLPEIRHADIVVAARQEAEAKLRREERLARQVEKDRQRDLETSRQAHMIKSSSGSSNARNSLRTKTTPVIGSKSRNVKSTKRI